MYTAQLRGEIIRLRFRLVLSAFIRQDGFLYTSAWQEHDAVKFDVSFPISLAEPFEILPISPYVRRAL